MFTVEEQHPVDVIGHDDERISLHCGVVARQAEPRCSDHGADGADSQAVTIHVAEETGPSERAYRDEVGTRAGVVEFPQSKWDSVRKMRRVRAAWRE